MVIMEEFKDVIGYEGLYQISNLGNVKSLKCNKEKILKLCITDDGYNKVNLYNNKLPKTFRVHQLVAMAFLGHTPDGMELVVDHINDNKLDNRVENLQIVTQRENAFKTQGNYSSKYKGVNFDKELNKFRAQIYIDGKLRHLGFYKCELQAALAYQNKLKEITL